MTTITLCLAAMSMLHPSAVTDQRWDTCRDIVHEARAQGVPPQVALAVAYVESRYNPDAISRAGALGPIQVLPQWHCPDGTAEGCDLIAEGIGLMRRLRLRHGNWLDAWCHYSSGTKCTNSGRRYADKVERKYRTLIIMLVARGVWVDPGLRPPRRLIR